MTEATRSAPPAKVYLPHSIENDFRDYKEYIADTRNSKAIQNLIAWSLENGSPGHYAESAIQSKTVISDLKPYTVRISRDMHVAVVRHAASNGGKNYHGYLDLFCHALHVFSTNKILFEKGGISKDSISNSYNEDQLRYELNP